MDPIRVMLVDDSEAFLLAAVEFLEQHDELAVVGTAHSGREALDQAPQLKPVAFVVGRSALAGRF
jgi:DNA-binding NarL/FixJ family response regulator